MSEDAKTPGRPTEEAQRSEGAALDPTGQKHLADALRVSFRVLAAIIVIVLILFPFSGIRIIDRQERGIKTIFGKVVATVDQGLSISWPFPIGSIEEVKIEERTLQIEDLWLHVRPEDLGKSEKRQWRTESEGLRPAWDGALLTGDHNLLHVMLDCAWTRWDPVAVNANIGDRQAIETMIRNALCGAAIRAAATRTAEALLRAERAGFEGDVKADAQRRLNVLTLDRRKVAEAERELAGILAALEPQKSKAARRKLTELIDTLMQGLRADRTRDELLKALGPAVADDAQAPLTALVGAFEHDGVRINRVQVADMTWPIRALAAFENAQKAKSRKTETINRAKADAAKILSEAAGRSYRKLIDFEKVLGESPKADRTGDHDLIGQYIKAREDGDDEKARLLLAKIDNVLVSNQTGGQASRLIAEARTFRTKIEQGVAARVDEFEKKIEGFEKVPKLTLDRLWAETREKVLGAPLAEKFYLAPSEQRIVIRINRDPNAARKIKVQVPKKKRE